LRHRYGEQIISNRNTGSAGLPADSKPDDERYSNEGQNNR
jgi:hypothetical protein